MITEGEWTETYELPREEAHMIHTDRKPGVKLVTDPPTREPMLTVRLREADIDDLLDAAWSVAYEHPERWGSASRFDAAVRRMRENKGRANL